MHHRSAPCGNAVVMGSALPRSRAVPEMTMRPRLCYHRGGPFRSRSMSDLAFMPAAELAARIARREVSPVEIVDDLLARIERSQPVINAFITVCAEAARAAA